MRKVIERFGRNGRDYLILACAALCLYLAGNQEVSLWDRDEPRYAETARNMLETGDTIVPYFNDEFRYQKPPLTYWLIAGSYKLFGVGNFAARFGTSLSVVFAVLGTAWLGNRLFGRPVGFVAAIFLGVAPVTVFLGKLCIPDGPQLLFSVLAMIALAEVFLSVNWLSPSASAEGTARGRSFALAFWIILGFSILTKGPIVLGMMLFTIVCYWLLTRVRLDKLPIRIGVGLAAMLAVVAPWCLLVLWTAGDDFFRESVGQQIVRRAVESFDKRFLPPGYYIATMLVGLAPATPFLLAGLRANYQNFFKPGPIAFLVSASLGPMILLELFRSKQAHYYAPAYPALALLAGECACRLFASSRGKLPEISSYRFVGGFSAFLGIALGVIFLGLAWFGPSETALITYLAGLAQIVISVVCYILAKRKRWERSLGIQLAGFYALWFVLVAIILPAGDQYRIVRPIGEHLSALNDKDAEFVMLKPIEPSMIYYAGKTLPEEKDFLAFKRALHFRDKEFLTVLSDQVYEWSKSAEGEYQLEIEKSWTGWVKMHRETVHLVRVTPKGASLFRRFVAEDRRPIGR